MKIIVVGAGEVGYTIARRLSQEDQDVVVIDCDEDMIHRVNENLDVHSILGSGSSPSILKEAGIKDADILLAVTNSDETNIVACLFANMESPQTFKIARIRNRDYLESKSIFEQEGININQVINPESEVINRITTLLQVPGASDVVEFAGGRVKLIGLNIKAGSPPVGKKLLYLKQETKEQPFLVGLIIRGEKMIIPSGKDIIMPGDFIYLVVEEKGISGALRAFDIEDRPLKKVLIVGGGHLGSAIAEQMDHLPVRAKIIEKKAHLCLGLADKLNRVMVLHGDGTDRNLLKEENIQDTEVVIAVTGDEETNVLISLLAKELGTKKTITRISKFDYIPLVHAIGLDAVVSPRLSAISAILQYVRKGKIISVASLKGEAAEVLEAVALETSEIVDKPLKDLDFPQGVLVGAIVRGREVLIPTGETLVRPQDRLIILSEKGNAHEVEKLLTVKLEFF